MDTVSIAADTGALQVDSNSCGTFESSTQNEALECRLSFNCLITLTFWR